jgi:peptide/nickel transport system permease protein
MTTRESITLLLSSFSGKAGVVLFISILLISLFVLLKLPLDFGSQRWNNPAEWADNPKSVAPEWIRLFNREGSLSHKTFQSSKPTIGEGTESPSYTFTYYYSGTQPPTFTSLSVSDIQFQDTPPILLLEVERPDGRIVRLLQRSMRGARIGEKTPFLRHTETPLRVFLSADQNTLFAISNYLQQEFSMKIGNDMLQGKLEQVLFGTPTETGGFVPLHGQYKFTLRVLANNPADSVGHVKLVLAGSHFGMMGTDSLGRDLALGLLFGFPVALTIGLSTAVLATTIGTILGIISGYMAGKTDIIIQRFADIWGNIPTLPLLIFLIFILGQKLWLVVLFLIIFGWPGLTIVVRSMVLQIRTGQLVEATKALGASRRRIMFRHILFQISPFVFAQMIFFVPAAILAEAGLSFIGLGDPSIPTWGQILESGFRTGGVFVGYWWWILPPGILIVLTSMTFVFLTLGLEPVVNPRLREGK